MEDVELRAELTMADMRIDLELAEDQCKLKITDTRGDEQAMLTCTPERAAAIFYLAIAGDCWPDTWISELYKLAEPVVGDLPMNLRPIP